MAVLKAKPHTIVIDGHSFTAVISGSWRVNEHGNCELDLTLHGKAHDLMSVIKELFPDAWPSGKTRKILY